MLLLRSFASGTTLEDDHDRVRLITGGHNWTDLTEHEHCRLYWLFSTNGERNV